MNQLLTRRLFPQVLAGAAALCCAIALAQNSANPRGAGARTDDRIEKDVVHALDASKALKNDLIIVTTIQSEVGLSGTVSTEASRELAEAIASYVPGVTKVHNNLKVGNPQNDPLSMLAQAPVPAYKAPDPQTRAPIDPNIGRSLSQELTSARQRYRTLQDREKILSPPDRLIGTYESQLIAKNMNDCDELLLNIDQQIHFLNYDNAKRDFAQLYPLFQATKTMLEEDALISGIELKRVSILDDGYAPLQSLPDLRGPALRAAIASEVSFAERLIRKTGVSEIDYVFAFSNLPRATTACSEVKDEFMRKGTDYGMKFNPDDQHYVSSPESYFSMANNELRLLHYSNAHELARYAYSEGQKILSICPAGPR